MYKKVNYHDFEKIHCPICSNNYFKIIGKPEISHKVKTFIKEDYQIVKCKNCQIYFVIPQISFSNNVWEELYDRNYFEKMTRWWANQRKKDRKYRLRQLEGYSNQKIINFLDVGCGEGYVLIEASERGWKAHGIDVFDNRIVSAKGKDILFSLGDIFDAQFPDNHFDCIYMDSVLEHVLNPIAYLKELNRIIKEYGVVYIGVPNEDCLFNDIKKLLYIIFGKGKISARIKPFVSPYHVTGFNRKPVMIASMKTNFEIVHFKNFGGFYELLKFNIFSRPFFINLFMLPIHLIAMLIGRQVYLEAILRKVAKSPQ
ncbi:MAG: class I SAM-dependent methyltransferase [Candidatus Scalindua sp.]